MCHLLHRCRNIGKPLRHRVGCEVDRHLHRIAQRGQYRIDALEAVDDLFDVAGKVVFQIAQLHVDVVVVLLDFDQIAKSQDDALIPILDEDIEVRVDDGGFVTPGDLEGRGIDAVDLCGLFLFIRFLSRVDDLHLHAPARGDGVFLQHIAHFGHQWSQQRVGAFAEITADQQRLLQPVEDVARGLGERVFVILGEIDPQAAQRVHPHVGHEQVQDDECRGQRQPTTLR